MIKVSIYEPSNRRAVETFREQTFAEGNNSLAYNKFNPDDFNGKIWLCWVDDTIVSLSAVEASHYTGDPTIAARVCRYHILKKHRHSHCGFMMLEQQIKWFYQSTFKVLYWTHDIYNKSLNAMYQHRRRMLDPQAKQWFDAEWYKETRLDTTRLFRVSEKSTLLQYIYFIPKDGFVWEPASNCIQYNHDGQIKLSYEEVLANVNN